MLHGMLQIHMPPWCLACVQNVFQRKMDQILAHCNGVIGIVDDIVVQWKDDEENDKWFHKFMKVAYEHGCAFNSDKCVVKQLYITFSACIYDANGAHSDPGKVSTVHNMPVPKTATQLQKFLSMVTYLSPFVPSLSYFTTPLWEIVKKGTEFIWNESYQEAFDTIKSMVLRT